MTALVTGGVTAASQTGTALTAHASANTKGDWEEIFAETPATCTGILVQLHTPNTQHGEYMVDVGEGADGSETVRVGNLRLSAPAGTRFPLPVVHYWFPITIASETRVAMRCQCSTGGAVASGAVSLTFDDWDVVPGSAVYTYGAVEATSLGATLTPALHPTEGAWVALTSDAAALRGFVLGLGKAGDTSTASRTWAIDIGTGEAASQVELLADFMLQHTDAESLGVYSSPYLPIPVASGEKLWGRVRVFDFASSDALDLTLYGVGA